VVPGILVASWSILAVELTLHWNSVEGVYNVKSTGQIIALVVGLGMLVKVLWLLRPGKVSKRILRSTDINADTCLRIEELLLAIAKSV
jgi:hypothetical protein